MTAFKSQYLADAALNWRRGTAYPTAPANTYIALITAAPTDRTGTGMVEATGGSYARQAVSNANWGAPVNSGSGTTAIRETSNSAALSFTSMPACTVVGIAEYDAVTAGNFLGYSDLTGGSQVVAAGATFSLPISNVLIEEA